MKTVHTVYEGNLRTLTTHLRSGNGIITDAPIDNQGKGKAFSPTDLMAASLGSCMLTMIGIAANKHGFSIDGTETSITKYMASNPRRIEKISVHFLFPANNFSDKQMKIIEKAALSCPSAISLHPDIVQDIQFEYAEAK